MKQVTKQKQDQPILEALKQRIELEVNLSYGDAYHLLGGTINWYSHIVVDNKEKDLTQIKI